MALVGLTGYEIYSILGRTTLLKLERIEVNALKRLSREEVMGLAGVKPGDGMLSFAAATVSASNSARTPGLNR